MSHTTKIKSVPIRDRQAIAAAVAELRRGGVNVELETNAEPRMYYADQLKNQLGREDEKCDYVLRLKDSKYDVGLIKEEDGTFSPVFDSWAGHVKTQLGATRLPDEATEDSKKLMPIGKFMQAYSKHAAMNAAVAKGYRVNSATTDANGNVQLRLSV